MSYDNIDNVVVGGIDWSDYPDMTDAFIESADKDGKPMSEEELDKLDFDFVYEHVLKLIT